MNVGSNSAASYSLPWCSPTENSRSPSPHPHPDAEHGAISAVCTARAIRLVCTTAIRAPRSDTPSARACSVLAGEAASSR